MPQITGSLFEGKPIVSVAVAEAMLPESPVMMPQQGAPAIHLREYRALLDTGADITCVLPHVVRENFLVSRGLVDMTSGNGSFQHMSYLIRLGIWCEKVVEVAGELDVERTLYQIPGDHIAAEIQTNAWFDVIIGMDIISQHTLSFTRGGQFVFNLG